MENKLSTWLSLLEEHESLLAKLETGLKDEKRALLANKLLLLREAALAKDLALRRLEEFQKRFQSCMRQSAADLGEKTASLRTLLKHFPAEDRRILEKKRQSATRLSRSISRLNRFNESCINTYLDQVNLMQSALSLATGQNRTYDAGGVAKKRDYGRLVNRSF